MTYYLVRAKAMDLDGLKSRLDSGEIRAMRPFGGELHRVLCEARVDGEWVIWEENCFFHPPLKKERAVLVLHFTDLTTEMVQQGEGWKQIDELPRYCQLNLMHTKLRQVLPNFAIRSRVQQPLTAVTTCHS